VPIKNEWQNGLKNERGTIAMARETEPDSATREFFINLADNARLDTAREKTGNAGYAVFGRVVKGMDVVDRIAAAPTRNVDVPGVTDGSMQNVPVGAVVIRKVERVK
jgi:peptidyl-prolyl cis-trans isomerase A (cyclophilin A)